MRDAFHRKRPCVSVRDNLIAGSFQVVAHEEMFNRRNRPLGHTFSFGLSCKWTTTVDVIVIGLLTV